MKHVIYHGQHDEVEVPALGLTFVKGQPVEVPDDAAARLLEQPANFKAAKKESSK